MKRLLIPLFLLMATCVAPLFANDQGGDGIWIPDYQELVREGFGPRHMERGERDEGPYRLHVGYEVRPMPTQAYYGKGYTVFYGFQAVREPIGQADTLYAFGYPADFYRRLMPSEVVNLNTFVAVIPSGGSDAAQKAPPINHGAPISTVQSVTPAKGTDTHSAVQEKPAR